MPKFACSKCGRSLKVQDGLAGRVRCPGCGQEQSVPRVPAADTEAAPPGAPPPPTSRTWEPMPPPPDLAGLAETVKQAEGADLSPAVGTAPGAACPVLTRGMTWPELNDAKVLPHLQRGNLQPGSVGAMLTDIFSPPARYLYYAGWFGVIFLVCLVWSAIFVGLLFGLCALFTQRLGMAVMCHLAFNATGLALVAG